MKKFLVIFDHCNLCAQKLLIAESVDDEKFKKDIMEFLFGLVDGDFKYTLSCLCEEDEKLKINEVARHLNIFEVTNVFKGDKMFKEAVIVAEKEISEERSKRLEKEKHNRLVEYLRLKDEFEKENL